MKNLTKILLIMVFAILPLSMTAQDVSDLVKLSKEYSQLETQRNNLKALIKQEEDKSYALRQSWYNTCKTYLQNGQVKAEELDLLISQTFPEIDGKEFYEELLKAKECLATGKEYQYQDIPVPTGDTDEPIATSSESKPKGKNGKKDGGKKSKKSYKKSSLSNENKEKHDVGDGEDKIETPPEQDEHIVTDPSKERYGKDKPSAPIKKEKSDKDENPAPVTTPVESDSKQTKAGKKYERDEMEESTSKKSKNSDGSR